MISFIFKFLKGDIIWAFSKMEADIKKKSTEHWFIKIFLRILRITQMQRRNTHKKNCNSRNTPPLHTCPSNMQYCSTQPLWYVSVSRFKLNSSIDLVLVQSPLTWSTAHYSPRCSTPNLQSSGFRFLFTCHIKTISKSCKPYLQT